MKKENSRTVYQICHQGVILATYVKEELSELLQDSTALVKKLRKLTEDNGGYFAGRKVKTSCLLVLERNEILTINDAGQDLWQPI